MVGGERQLAAVAQPQPPAHDLPCFQVKHYRQVVPLALEPQIGKVLYPGTGVGHAGVALAVLRAGLVPEDGIVSEGIWSGRYLDRRRGRVFRLLTRPGNDNAGFGPDVPGLLLAPAKVQRQSAYSVEGMGLMGGNEGSLAVLVFAAPPGGFTVVCRTVYLQDARKPLPPAWLDFFQDG